MYKYRCEHCNARLDPGEKCDCRDKKRIETEKLMNMLTMSNGGQYVLNIGGAYGIKKL